ncbi:hypothetical protein KFL_006680010 [Klebsormidium nitens]|uniref:Inosine/uridine-preferring nucleoside hydrolase domain-containing protein n=1 Tax=Klebsormidium nitens TaxID=105231 RepID=A0A1Y1IID8_KLENI|nr:hypothetical protein KFL_006680010 [Klebsormidium nitens]|eukprot:GAQ90650.1 hypothetical protein KFL_006680010 [Klebsormidium nitens]
MALSGVGTMVWVVAVVLSAAVMVSEARSLLQDPCNPCFSADGSSQICCTGGRQCGPLTSAGLPTCSSAGGPSCNPCYSADGSSSICCNGPDAQCGPQLASGAPTCVPVVAPKVIIDTDFNTIGDDGQVVAMAAQLYAQGVIDILGLTVATGNAWLDQELVEILKAVERLGIATRVGVYAGAAEPFPHTFANYTEEVALFGDAIDYVGAYATPPPSASDLVPPPDGFASATQPKAMNAVDFIIEQVKKYPGEVTILEIAPAENVANAILKDPSIVPLVKQVVTQGGQMYVGGNSYRDVAEFNWWFAPDAARTVLRSGIPAYIIPLDATNKIPLTLDTYTEIATHEPATIITELYRNAFAAFFGPGPPPYPLFVFDTLALAYLVDPSLATDVRTLYICEYGLRRRIRKGAGVPGGFPRAGECEDVQGDLQSGRRPVQRPVRRPADPPSPGAFCAMILRLL